LVLSAVLILGIVSNVFGQSGRVLAGGKPVAGSTVTLFSASAGAPAKLAEAKTDDQGAFTLAGGSTAQGSLYVVAKGGRPLARPDRGPNPAIAFLAVLGPSLPKTVTVNEFTTIASVWTNAQFLDGETLKGHALGLKIAAGNVPNFVDLATGGYGDVILNPVNSGQTPTLAMFGTLANVMAGCATRETPDACARFFAASTGWYGKTPTDTLGAAESIARAMPYKPERIFGLLDAFYPVPKGPKPHLRPTPFLPYLSLAPSAWVLPLMFTGGGLVGSAKAMFTSEGDAWIGANFVVGLQGGDAFWNGNLSKFTANGKALSPPITGFAGGGLRGPGFGLTVDRNDRAWITSTSGATISLFDKDGKPLSPPEGWNFGGKLKNTQGIIVVPNGDVWAVDPGSETVVHMPKGDPAKAKLYCGPPPGQSEKDNTCKLSYGFGMAIDQQDRIWITNAVGDHVTRFPASDPSGVESFPTGGHSGKGMAIDSKGNAWITNTLGSGLTTETKLHLLDLKLTHRDSEMHQVVLRNLLDHPGLGSVSILGPDGKPLPGSPVEGIWGAWAVSIDGNDHAFVSQFAPGGGIVELCGARTETCPPGMKTGDVLSPPGGYKGGGMVMLVDSVVDPAGNVWATNNWQDPAACYAKAAEGSSTRCGGQGFTVFYGLAKPVQAPLIGPAKPL
jgi:hypothetical protein